MTTTMTMTSRRTEKRSLRKCEVTVESLNARIAPAGFHAGSLFVAGTGGHVEIGKYHAPKFKPFLLDRTGKTNYLIKGEGPIGGNLGSNHNGHNMQPFLNLAVSKISIESTTNNDSTSVETAPGSIRLIGPPKVVNLTTTDTTTNQAPSLPIRLIGPPKVVIVTTTDTESSGGTGSTGSTTPLQIRMIGPL